MPRQKNVARKAGGGTRPPDGGTEDGDGTGLTQRIELQLFVSTRRIAHVCGSTSYGGAS